MRPGRPKWKRTTYKIEGEKYPCFFREIQGEMCKLIIFNGSSQSTIIFGERVYDYSIDICGTYLKEDDPSDSQLEEAYNRALSAGSDQTNFLPHIVKDDAEKTSRSY